MRRFPKASDVRATAPIARTSQRESPIIIPKAHHAHDTPLRGELICQRARKVNASQYRIAGRRHFRESAGALRGGMDGRLRLERDDFSLNRHPALASCLSMIFSENRCTLFGIML
jgi:hypothetical protein